MRKAFTLAEILITLVIIGVVAAMTIQTLIAKINKIVIDNQTKVFNAKIIKGLNLTKTAGDLNNTYSSTYDFLVNGLGKNLKMAKVCDKDHIRDCIPYDKIKYDDQNNNEYNVDVKDIELKLNLLSNVKGFKDTAAFVLSDGTPVIVTYDLDCIDDPDKADTAINKCLAGIYDLNGTRKPNKMGQDLVTFNGASIKGAVLATLGAVKIISMAQAPTQITIAECRALKNEGYPISECGWDNDYWAGAVKMCHEMGGHLPTGQQLANIATALYGGAQGGESYSDADESGTKIYGLGEIGTSNAVPEALSGLGSSWFYLWSNAEYSMNSADERYFDKSYSMRTTGYRFLGGWATKAVCVKD